MTSPGKELEQLERLHAENTHRRCIIAHTIYSYLIPSQNKTKSKLQNLKKCKQIRILEFYQKKKKKLFTRQHLLKLLVNMFEYEMDPASIVEDTERTRFRLQTDRRVDKLKPISPLPTSLKRVYDKNRSKCDILEHHIS